MKKIISLLTTLAISASILTTMPVSAGTADVTRVSAVNKGFIVELANEPADTDEYTYELTDTTTKTAVTVTPTFTQDRILLSADISDDIYYNLTISKNGSVVYEKAVKKDTLIGDDFQGYNDITEADGVKWDFDSYGDKALFSIETDVATGNKYVKGTRQDNYTSASIKVRPLDRNAFSGRTNYNLEFDMWADIPTAKLDVGVLADSGLDQYSGTTDCLFFTSNNGITYKKPGGNITTLTADNALLGNSYVNKMIVSAFTDSVSVYNFETANAYAGTALRAVYDKAANGLTGGSGYFWINTVAEGGYYTYSYDNIYVTVCEETDKIEDVAVERVSAYTGGIIVDTNSQALVKEKISAELKTASGEAVSVTTTVTGDKVLLTGEIAKDTMYSLAVSYDGEKLYDKFIKKTVIFGDDFQSYQNMEDVNAEKWNFNSYNNMATFSLDTDASGNKYVSANNSNSANAGVKVYLRDKTPFTGKSNYNLEFDMWTDSDTPRLKVGVLATSSVDEYGDSGKDTTTNVLNFESNKTSFMKSAGSWAEIYTGKIIDGSSTSSSTYMNKMIVSAFTDEIAVYNNGEFKVEHKPDVASNGGYFWMYFNANTAYKYYCFDNIYATTLEEFDNIDTSISVNKVSAYSKGLIIDTANASVYADQLNISISDMSENVVPVSNLKESNGQVFADASLEDDVYYNVRISYFGNIVYDKYIRKSVKFADNFEGYSDENPVTDTWRKTAGTANDAYTTSFSIATDGDNSYLKTNVGVYQVDGANKQSTMVIRPSDIADLSNLKNYNLEYTVWTDNANPAIVTGLLANKNDEYINETDAETNRTVYTTSSNTGTKVTYVGTENAEFISSKNHIASDGTPANVISSAYTDKTSIYADGEYVGSLSGNGYPGYFWIRFWAYGNYSGTYYAIDDFVLTTCEEIDTVFIESASASVSGNDINVSFNIKNASESEKPLKVIAAAYKDGIMLNAKIFDVSSIAGDAKYQDNGTIVGAANADTVCVFAWKDISGESLMPYCGKFVIDMKN